MMQNVLLYEKKLLLLSRWFHFSANMCTKIFNNHAAKREVFVQIFCIHWRELWWLKTIRYHLWRDYRNSPKSNSASASAIHEHCGDEKNPVNSVKVRISAQPLPNRIISITDHKTTNIVQENHWSLPLRLDSSFLEANQQTDNSPPSRLLDLKTAQFLRFPRLAMVLDPSLPQPILRGWLYVGVGGWENQTPQIASHSMWHLLSGNEAHSPTGSLETVF